MPYVAPGTVAAGDVYTAAAHNIQVANVISLRALANVTQGLTTTSTALAGTAYANTGLSGTITPTFSDSKVLIHITQWFSSTPNAADIGFSTVKVVRGSTDIWLPLTNNRTPVQLNATGLGSVGTFWTFTYLDSPASITATVYKTMVRTAGGTFTITAQADSIQSQIVLQEIPA